MEEDSALVEKPRPPRVELGGQPVKQGHKVLHSLRQIKLCQRQVANHVMETRHETRKFANNGQFPIDFPFYIDIVLALVSQNVGKNSPVLTTLQVLAPF